MRGTLASRAGRWFVRYETPADGEPERGVLWWAIVRLEAPGLACANREGLALESRGGGRWTGCRAGVHVTAFVVGRAAAEHRDVVPVPAHDVPKETDLRWNGGRWEQRSRGGGGGLSTPPRGARDGRGERVDAVWAE